MLKALLKDSIGFECLTLSNLLEGLEPTILSRFLIPIKLGRCKILFLFKNCFKLNIEKIVIDMDIKLEINTFD